MSLLLGLFILNGVAILPGLAVAFNEQWDGDVSDMHSLNVSLVGQQPQSGGVASSGEGGGGDGGGEGGVDFMACRMLSAILAQFVLPFAVNTCEPESYGGGHVLLWHSNGYLGEQVLLEMPLLPLLSFHNQCLIERLEMLLLPLLSCHNNLCLIVPWEMPFLPVLPCHNNLCLVELWEMLSLPVLFCPNNLWVPEPEEMFLLPVLPFQDSICLEEPHKMCLLPELPFQDSICLGELLEMFLLPVLLCHHNICLEELWEMFFLLMLPCHHYICPLELWVMSHLTLQPYHHNICLVEPWEMPPLILLPCHLDNMCGKEPWEMPHLTELPCHHYNICQKEPSEMSHLTELLCHHSICLKEPWELLSLTVLPCYKAEPTVKLLLLWLPCPGKAEHPVRLLLSLSYPDKAEPPVKLLLLLLLCHDKAEPPVKVFLLLLPCHGKAEHPVKVFLPMLPCPDKGELPGKAFLPMLLCHDKAELPLKLLLLPCLNICLVEPRENYEDDVPMLPCQGKICLEEPRELSRMSERFFSNISLVEALSLDNSCLWEPYISHVFLLPFVDIISVWVLCENYMHLGCELTFVDNNWLEEPLEMLLRPELPFQDNICLWEPCENYMPHVSVLPSYGNICLLGSCENCMPLVSVLLLYAIISVWEPCENSMHCMSELPFVVNSCVQESCENYMFRMPVQPFGGNNCVCESCESYMHCAPVLPFNDNICVQAYCKNYRSQVYVLPFDSSAPFIASTSTLYQPIHPVGDQHCGCQPEFIRDYYETGVDFCCSRCGGTPGACYSPEEGYDFVCHCPEGFADEHCEVNAHLGLCAPRICKNGSTDVNLLVSGFNCNFPSGDYEKPYCQVTISFPAPSFQGLQQCFHFILTFMFATKRETLLYSGRLYEKHDFVSIEVIQEQAGNSTTIVYPFILGGVSDGKWHTVQLLKPLLGSSALSQGLSELKMTVVMMDIWIKFLDVLPELPESFPICTSHFVGHISVLQVDRQCVDIVDFITEEDSVPGLLAMKNEYDSNTCHNRGTCANQWDIFSYKFFLDYGGKNAQELENPHHILGRNLMAWHDLELPIHQGGGIFLQRMIRGHSTIIIKSTRMGETADGTNSRDLSRAAHANVQQDYSFPDPCNSDPCPTNDYYSVDSCSCSTGYYSDSHANICTLNPCEHLSQYTWKPHGYICKFPHNYSEIYCETRIDQLCPQHWWGHLTCDPCNCDFSQDSDPNRNKTSGQCCFKICDPEDSQLPFKPGIIWPQCDHCGNPFAKVTINHCKAPPDCFSPGIAVWHCDEHQGWLPPCLFSYISVTFLELKAFAEQLQRNELALDTVCFQRLALLLQNAIQPIAAIQNANFTKKTLRVGCFYLNIVSKHHWDLIQQMKSGTAWLLNQYEAYATILGQIMLHTYRSPITAITFNIDYQPASAPEIPGEAWQQKELGWQQRRHPKLSQEQVVANKIICHTLACLLPHKYDPIMDSLCFLPAMVPTHPVINMPVGSISVHSDENLYKPDLVQWFKKSINCYKRKTSRGLVRILLPDIFAIV